MLFNGRLSKMAGYRRKSAAVKIADSAWYYVLCLQLWPPCRLAEATRLNGGHILGTVIFQTFFFQS